MSADPLRDLLRDQLNAGVIGALDAHFGDFLARHSRASREETALAGALLSAAAGRGDVCIALDELAEAAAGLLPPPDTLRAALMQSGALAQEGAAAPLVLENDNLYLYRYWQYENAVAREVRARAATPAPIAEDAVLARALAARFADTGAADQQIAAAIALSQSFSVITGGPGTGKTTTVKRVLAILEELAPQAPRIALTAPTGKAAARLQEALRRDDVTTGVAASMEAQTLHRLLGSLPDSTRFRHHRDYPLALDVLVVDEASMIDLALMAKLLDALPRSTRLILLGDKDQLASVEAGAVLSSLCAHAGAYSPVMAARLQSLTGQSVPAQADRTPLADNIATLRRTYRFDTGGAIGAVAAAALSGDADAALRALTGDHASLIDAAHTTQIVPALAEPYLALLDAARAAPDAQSVLTLIRRYAVLCAHREGPYGAARINAAIEKHLRRLGAAPAHGEWYPGRLVIMNRNDYALGLFNGEIGVCLRDEAGELAVYFPASRGGVARFAVARVAACETAFAMTVHKAQGSEFDEVAFVLPQQSSPILSRELFYTAVTRAAKAIRIFAAKDILRATLARRVLRKSALGKRLT